MPLAYYAALYFSVLRLSLSPAVERALSVVTAVVVTVLGVRLITSMIRFAILKQWIARGDENVARRAQGLMPIVTVVIWGLGAVFFLDNLGFKISAIMAGLGIGGIAVALASQAILGDLFSYFCIIFDRPFELGDFIIVGDYMGTVEYTGIKTTRIRSLSGEQLVLSNTDLTSSRIRNYKRMQRRRVLFSLDIVYDTALHSLVEVPEIVKNAILSVENTEFDRAHFATFGKSSLVIEVVYYVLSADYNVYMNIQQHINYKIKEEFDKRQIAFAYPTQTLYMAKSAEASPV